MAEKNPQSQTDDQKSGKKTTEIPWCSPNLLVAAIDFGTTYSGYAFSSRADFDDDPLRITAHKWSSGLISEKNPTSILFDNNQKLVAFGYEAEKQFTELSNDNRHEDFYYFQRFKMQLYHHNKDAKNKQLPINSKSMLSDISGKKMLAMDVFSAAIKYMKEHLLHKLSETGDTETKKEEIRWVLTVPAIWNDTAKSFMRESAIKAGIRGDCLTIALEPEAASMYCKRLPIEMLNDNLRVQNEGFQFFSQGNQYLVLDAGGGTVDITVHEVLSGDRIKELHKASGGAWGGTYVDENFFDIIKEAVGKEKFESFKKEDLAGYNDLRKDLEVKKREINTESTKISFTIPNQLAQVIPKDYNPEILECKKGKLELKVPGIKKWFSEICDSIVSHVEELLEEQKKKQRNIESILMVGGFSESSFLQETVKTAFPNKHIIVPNQAGLAVLKGAVLFGHNPQIVDSRVAKVTYGVNTLSKIQDERDVPDKSRIRTINGVKYEKNVFSKHVTKGDDLVIGQAQEEKTYFPIYPDQKSVQFSVFSSQEENPKYVDGCKRLGSFDVKIPYTTDGTDRKVVVRFIFGGTEIKFECEDANGEITPYTFDWSENAEEECFGMAVERGES
ncbi:heat shock 70 kDa protein 12A-like [Crassostrea angulata]|uniref:heat shock 70 kDa protein 12A-like n=1 Tax=Magallana angulata TaxID=2784310 RepID=UPI0022B1B190|nr:heat shock 70 kDa protein 12A-like [Crassostrea angulata]